MDGDLLRAFALTSIREQAEDLRVRQRARAARKPYSGPQRVDSTRLGRARNGTVSVRTVRARTESLGAALEAADCG